MPADLTARNIRTVDQYLELVAGTIFASGLSWEVVERRWPEIRSAFAGFAAVKVAALSDRDLHLLSGVPGVIANTAKIEAVRAAARFLVDKRNGHGSVGRWLGSLVGFEHQQRALRQLRFIGPFGAYYVLSVAGFDVPEYETWQAAFSTAAYAG